MLDSLTCWSQETNDDFDWTVDAGGTPSGGTGPSDDFTGGGNYMYTESCFTKSLRRCSYYVL